METIRQFDVGVTIALPITEDGSAVILDGSTVTLRFQPPGVPAFDRVATFANGTNLAEYVTQPGDVGWWGLWRVMAHVVFTGGSPDLHTVAKTFYVDPLIGLVPLFVRPDPVRAVGLVPVAFVA